MLIAAEESETLFNGLVMLLTQGAGFQVDRGQESVVVTHVGANSNSGSDAALRFAVADDIVWYAMLAAYVLEKLTCQFG